MSFLFCFQEAKAAFYSNVRVCGRVMNEQEDLNITNGLYNNEMLWLKLLFDAVYQILNLPWKVNIQSYKTAKRQIIF